MMNSEQGNYYLCFGRPNQIRLLNGEQHGKRKYRHSGGVRTVVLLAIFGVLGVMNGVIGNGWERDFVLLRRVPTLLPILLPFPLAAWT